MTQTRPKTIRIGCVLPRFPILSESFVTGEVIRLKRAGLAIQPVVLDRSGSADAAPLAAVRAEGIAPIYLMDSPVRLALRVGITIARHPRLALAAWLLNARTPIPSHASRLGRWLKTMAVVELVNRLRLDRLHAHWTLPSDIALLVHKVAAVPYGMSAHATDIYGDDAGSDEVGRPGSLMEKIEQADFVATCTARNREHLRALAPRAASRVHLVYHGVDLSRFDGVRPEPGARSLILSVGRLLPLKGFATLIRACASLRDAGLDFECQIVGEGPERDELERLIAELELGATVELAGAKNHDEVRDLLRRAAVFALCPEAEQGHYGIPNVLFEALAMRVATVTKRLPGLEEELIDSGRNGIVFDHDSQLVTELERLLRDPAERRRLGDAGRSTIEERFDADRTIQQLVDQLVAR